MSKKHNETAEETPVETKGEETAASPETSAPEVEVLDAIAEEIAEENAEEKAKEEQQKQEEKKDEVTQYYAALERLRKELEEKDRKLIEYIQAHKKHVQESDRVRQRLRDDMDRKLKTANADLLKRILPVFDDLERAMQHAEKSNDVQSLANGVRMVVSKFYTEFDNAGLVQFANKGEKFNPNLEEAISIIPVMSAEQDDIVIEVLQAGYRIGDHLVRPAKVVVGKFSG